MKKLAALLIAFIAFAGTQVYADGVEIYRISDDAALHCVNTVSGQSGWSVADGANVGGFLLTENGYMLTDGELVNKTVSLTQEDNRRVISFLPSQTYDFESVADSEEIFGATIVQESEKSFLAASAESPATMTLTDSAKGANFTLAFDAYKSVSEAAVLFSVCDENGNKACEVKLNRRGSTSFYPACLEGESYTTYHDYLISKDEWFSVEVYADFENGNVSVKIPSVEFDVTYPLSEVAGSDFSVSEITFGQSIDNVNFYNGRKIQNAQFSFDSTDIISVPAGDLRYCVDIPVIATLDGVSGRLSKTADFLVYSTDNNMLPDGKMVLPKSLNDVLVKARCFALDKNIEISKTFSFASGENAEATPVDYPIADVVRVDVASQKAIISGYNPTDEDFSVDVYICVFKSGECLKIRKYPVTMEALCGEFTKEVMLDLEDGDMTGATSKAFVMDAAMKDIQ